jgi:transposase
MPWRASSVMEERLRFVARLLDGEAMTDVCREFGISRKTGYKIFDRYKQQGLEALSDRSRRPVRYANQLPDQIETLIVQLKAEKPYWGARKIRELLVRRLDGDIRVPAKSLFRDRGLPLAIRSDNGVPFASPNALFNLSKLSVWWLRLGIVHRGVVCGDELRRDGEDLARRYHIRRLTADRSHAGGPQGKSEDQPHAKQIAPAEGVTPQVEVHACPTVHSAPCTTRYRCLPTGVTGSRSRPTPPGFGQIVLCRPDAWLSRR